MTSHHCTTIRLTAGLLSLVFLVSDLAWAAPTDGLVLVKPSALETLAGDPARFEAPSEFATLKEVRKNSGPFIIHIQDAHSNYSGQQNIASALDDLMTRYKISLVLVEGGSKDDTLTPIKRVAPPDVWKKVARKFLLAGRIAGEEYLNLISDHPMKIMGIEDKPLYL